MNIVQFFSNNKFNEKEKFSKNNNKNEHIQQKRLIHKQFINKLNKLFSNKGIESTEYTFLMEFIKSGGTIVNAQQFFEITEKINKNDKIDENDKKEFNKYCELLFQHLYNLFVNMDISNNKINIDELIKDIELYNKNTFTFTEDQKEGIKNICGFLYNTKKTTHGLYGYAGTGKTTTITKLIHYLLYKNYINSIVFTAPTNKAVNVIKSKFRNDLDDLLRNKFKTHLEENMSFDDILEKLEEKGFKVHFLTIHKLLNYQNDFDIEGERIFIKGDKASISNYDLVIVDECSMIPFQIVSHLFEEANKTNLLAKRRPKILYIGDHCQLPPVNEKISIVFAKNDKDFNFELYKNQYIKNSTGSIELDKQLTLSIENKFKELKNQILQMEYTVLRQVMRSNNDKVIGLCNEFRAWILNEIKAPMSYKFKGEKVFLYKCPINEKTKIKNKINNTWFNKCVEYFKSNNEKQHVSNIILTWTNKQTDEYNDSMRKIIFNKQKLNKFEIGDILILTDFYNIKETEVKPIDKKIESKRFYTSEQIKVTDIEHVVRGISEFTEGLSKKLGRIKNIHDIEEKYIKSVKLINKNTIRKYNTWKLYVHRLTDIVVDSMPETHQIYVVDDDSIALLIKDRKFVADEIKKLRNYYRNIHKENINLIDTKVIRPLWRELNNKLVDPFAKVSIAISISIHRSQASTFYNVFVDADDVLKNSRDEESKRCFYTAITRCSNELHILF